MGVRFARILRATAFTISFLAISASLLPVPLLADGGENLDLHEIVISENISKNAKLDSQLNQLVAANAGQDTLSSPYCCLRCFKTIGLGRDVM